MCTSCRNSSMRNNDIAPSCTRRGAQEQANFKVGTVELSQSLPRNMQIILVSTLKALLLSASRVPFYLLRLWCPLRLRPGVHCLWRVRRSIIRFFCRHALRLRCATTGRDGSRVGTTMLLEINSNDFEGFFLELLSIFEFDCRRCGN